MAATTRTITETLDVYVDGRYVQTTQTREQRIVTGQHCQSCGSTSAESVGWDALAERDGYTACCNEIAVIECTARDCYHD